MTCHACGEKPKDTAKDFTKAVIEIDNPEEIITLLRKVIIPASMGTEEQVPAAVGKYRNVILYYEANKHVYIYSSDGIPTLLEVDIPQEILDRIDALEDGLGNEIEARAEADETLQGEIDALKNSPDVVDIVATYADLQAYDTSSLGDKDVIRVLTDETHDDESSYYRWSTETQTWTFIGATGPYYTKGQTDALLNEKQDNLTAGDNITIENNVISADDWIATLTSDDYDYPDNNPDGVAVWSLPTGMYRAPNGVNVYNDSATSGSGGNRLFFVNSDLPGSNSIIYYPGASIALFVVNKSTGSLVLDTSTLLTSQVVDALTSTATDVPLSANQGKVLKGLIDGLDTTVAGKQDTLTAGEAINITSNVISATNTGQAKLLTADDYNWNKTTGSATEPFDSIALWLLPTGMYKVDKSSDQIPVLADSVTTPLYRIDGDLLAIVTRDVGSGGTIDGASLYVSFRRAGGGAVRPLIIEVRPSTVSPYWRFNSVDRNSVSPGSDILIGKDIVDGVNSLNSANHYKVLSAWQGYVLNNKIEDRIKESGTAAPTTSTIGTVGELYAYVENGTGHLAICTEVTSNPTDYIWQILV